MLQGKRMCFYCALIVSQIVSLGSPVHVDFKWIYVGIENVRVSICRVVRVKFNFYKLFSPKSPHNQNCPCCLTDQRAGLLLRVECQVWDWSLLYSSMYGLQIFIIVVIVKLLEFVFWISILVGQEIPHDKKMANFQLSYFQPPPWW